MLLSRCICCCTAIDACVGAFFSPLSPSLILLLPLFFPLLTCPSPSSATTTFAPFSSEIVANVRPTTLFGPSSGLMCWLNDFVRFVSSGF
ncbi:hypothetical protein AX774_g6769 [Zancudomyces culisetae]|uniref:Secreted peptide n=1 Tax=Zancudomyces culisetae TaxID=1213189 RepID=A0A1R1PFW8_ZANCU|nr:hypothetical protein AX774_g6769 [Zancudomyces culisetae]|eukprot:OMH79808.1 hypothetical protein AX774_g6769 [Zancudomyces culisetae]